MWWILHPVHRCIKRQNHAAYYYYSLPTHAQFNNLYTRIRFTVFAQLLVLAPLAHSFVIPKDTEDGVYVVHINDHGQEVHEKLGTVSTGDDIQLFEERDDVSPNPALMPRDRGSDYFCGCNNKMNHGHCDAAVKALKADVTNKKGIFPARSSFYAIHQSVVAFVCNRGETFGWAPGNMAGYFAGITDRCGWYTAGTHSTWDGKLHALVGYMNYRSGLDFCKASDSSPQHSC